MKLDRARHSTTRRRAQKGTSLVELLVAMMISLMVMGAAIGTLILSRTASATVSDLSLLQQQASFALRIIGLQVRQAGALDLVKSGSIESYSFNNGFSGVGGKGMAVSGVEGAVGASDTVSFSNQPSSTLKATQARDCLGDTIPEALLGIRMDSTFYVVDDSLRCRGAGTSTQPLIANVADFQVWYRVRSTGDSIRRMKADAVEAAALWNSVRSIEVCLSMQGNESGHPGAGNYVDCNGNEVARKGRLHLVYTNVFDLRTQGS